MESGSERMLAHIDKRITPAMVRSVVRRLTERGIGVKGYFILGLPTETPAPTSPRPSTWSKTCGTSPTRYPAGSAPAHSSSAPTPAPPNGTGSSPPAATPPSSSWTTPRSTSPTPETTRRCAAGMSSTSR
ncbi:hypothetical protein [Actinomadura decatromicini]|uniref:hypothetical protein n=1 Tax=Actinomadura decatromicini TaxID=2604572 RepID=UPI003CCC6A7C